jgi:hypothetical protein
LQRLAKTAGARRRRRLSVRQCACERFPDRLSAGPGYSGSLSRRRKTTPSSSTSSA